MAKTAVKEKKKKYESLIDEVLDQCPGGMSRQEFEKTPRLFPDNSSKFVFGNGDVNAELMIVGQAPGYEEDRDGVPFVGRAGRTLWELAESAGVFRKECWVTNVCKEYPPNDREPTPKEVTLHLPYLLREILTVKPKVIVLLGNASMSAFLGKRGITKMHGNIYTKDFGYGEVKLVPAFHPSYVMRKSDDRATRMKFLKDIGRVRKLVTGLDTPQNQTKNEYRLVATEDQARRLFAALRKAEVVDFDLETTTKDPDTGKIICISFSIRENRAAVLPLYLTWKDGKRVDLYKYWGDRHSWIMSELKSIFESPLAKCAHTGHLIDAPFLRAEGIQIDGYAFDTIIMHFLNDENIPLADRSLKDLAWELTDMGGYDAEVDQWKEKLKKKGTIDENGEISFADIPFETLWPYSAADADVLGRVRRILFDKLRKQNLSALLKKISMPLQQALFDVEYNGVKIDRDKLRTLRDEYAEMREDVKKQLNAHPATERALEILNERRKPKAKEIKELNYGSSVQLRVVLYEVLGFVVTKKTKTKQQPSTDKEVLEELAGRHEIPRLILQKRDYEYFEKYYGEDFEGFIRKDGRVHTNYLTYKARTGRLSSQRPNLQNVPRADEGSIAGLVRSIFIAEEGHVLIEADYSQIEYRLLANYSQDPQMIEDILNDRDIHVINATFVYDKEISDVTPQERQNAKPLTYALIYGATIYRIMSLYGVSEDRATQIVDSIFARYPGAKAYHEAMVSMARTKGFVQNIFGRRRRLRDILSDNKKLRGHAERQAINAPIQGLAGEVLSVATIRLAKVWRKIPELARMVMTIHDSLVHEALESRSEEAIAKIYWEMTRSIKGITVPIPVEVKVGKSLGDMKKLSREELAVILEKYPDSSRQI